VVPTLRLLLERNGHGERQEIEMGAEWTIPPVMGVIFVATLIRSAFGFGEALVAVPLLALLIPVEQDVPLATHRLRSDDTNRLQQV
jgi:hypothetical protein